MKCFKKIFTFIVSVILLAIIVPVTNISVHASTDETWLWPTSSPQGITISSSFGYRNTSNNTHKAIDIKCEMGTPILATKSGTVYRCEQKYGSDEKTTSGGTKSWGNYIILKHKDGTYSLYAHLSQDDRTLPKGKEVKQGDTIAYSGDSGHSSGPHLHFSARSDYGGAWSDVNGLINVMPTEEFINKHNISYTSYKLPNDWPSTRMTYLDWQNCEHQYEKNYESEHPHAEYKVCKCGSKTYTGNHKKETNCSLCINPLLYSFDTVDGNTVYTYSEQYDITVTIFSHNQCNNSKKLIQVIAQNPTLLKSTTRILFVDTNKNTKQTVKALEESLGASKVEFCYDSSDKAYNAMRKYANDAGFGNSITFPIIVFTKKDGTVFKVLQGEVEPDYFFQLANGDLSQDMSVNLNISGTENYDYANEVLKKLNALRKSLNLQTLTMDQNLLTAAMQRAAEISIYYSHTRPNGTNCKTVSNNIKINAENIAIGQNTPADVMNSWTNSSGHYANMTKGDFKSVGIGCFTTSEGYLCWVQVFSKDSPTVTSKNGTLSATHVIKANGAHLSLAVYADKDPHLLKKGESVKFRVENTNKGFNYVVQRLNVSDFSFKSNNDVVTFNLVGDCIANGSGKVTLTAEHKQSESIKSLGLYTIGHKYTNSCDTICNVCNANRTIKHTYTNACDTTCNVCKAKRTIKHTYSNNCDTSCNVCKATRTVTHAYKTTTTKATLTKNGSIVKKCTVCGKVLSKTTIKYAKTFKLSTTTYTYNGKVKTPSVTVKDSTGKTLKKNTDYTVTYANGRKNVGTYKVTIKMIGKYSGTKTLTFKINPAKTTISKLTAGKKSITVAITKKSTQVTGYQIQYSTSKTFSTATTKTISSYKTTTHTLKGLSAKKTYYVRVRTYKKVGNTTYYSGWSAYKYVKTK